MLGKWKIVAGLSLFFLAGFFFGMAAEKWRIYRKAFLMATERNSFLKDQILDSLSSELQFSDQERESAGNVLKEAFKRMEKIHEQQKPALKDLFRKTLADLKKILSPEKAKIMENLVDSIGK